MVRQQRGAEDVCVLQVVREAFRLEVVPSDVPLFGALVLLLEDLAEGQALPVVARFELAPGPDDVRNGERRDDYWSRDRRLHRVDAAVEDTGHADDVYYEPDVDVRELRCPKYASEVGLLGLGKDHRVPVDNTADKEIDPRQKVDGWRHCAVDEADAHHRGEAGGAGTYAVIVLVLRLTHLGCLLLRIEGAEALELRILDVPREVHEMHEPLQHNIVAVVVRSVRQRVAQQREDREGRCEQGVRELEEVGADRRDHDHEDHVEPEVPGLHLVLRPRARLEGEEVLEDDHEERGKEGDHELEARGGCHYAPKGVQRTHVHELRDVRDHDDERQVGHVEPHDEQEANDLAPGARVGVLLQIAPQDVRRRRRVLDGPHIPVLGDVDRQCDLGEAALGEGDEAR
mmetsp:Transcript_131714/g.357667  ORF Transcript_131714/g.357667 Transcript_131714/m.357667 type:complete len:400 (+) Transcript_131714:360-1559(+)